MRTLEEQKRGRCVHFSGTINKTCDVGVEYDAVAVKGKGIPCLRGGSFRGEELECTSRRWPTEEEVQAMVEESTKRTQVMLSGLAAVAVDAEAKGFGKGNGGSGEVECPVCDGGVIYYSVSGYNGHRHARCTTPGCVAFME